MSKPKKSNPNQKPKQNQNQPGLMSLPFPYVKPPKINYAKLVEEMQRIKNKYEVNTPERAKELYAQNADYKKDIDTSASERTRGHLRKLEHYVAEKFMKTKFGDDYPTKSPSEMITDLTIIASDDISSILGMAGRYVAPALTNLAKEYGPQVLSWLYKKFQSKFKTQGHGSGPGQHSFTPLDKIVFTDNNTINLQYLAAVICPEVYCSAMSSANDPYVVSTGKEVITPLITGADGNAFMIIMDDAVCCQGVNTSYFSAQTQINSTYNATAGSFGGPGLTYSAGPYFNAGASNISTFRLAALATKFIPSVSSLNNAGKVSVYYNTQSSNLAIGTTNPVIPVLTLLQSPFIHIAPLKSPEFRQIGVINDVIDTSLDPFANILTSFGNNGYKFTVITVTGALANTQIGDVYVQANIDYTPGDSLAGIVKPLPTPDAPATLMCFASIIKQFPQICNLGVDDSKDIASYVRECPESSYPVLISHLQKRMLSYKKKPTFMASQSSSQMNNIGDISFDVIQE